MPHNNARPLVGRDWGYNWLELIPPEFRSALKYKITKTPGVPNGTLPDEPTGLVITSKINADRINEVEKETIELDSALNLPITTKNHEITKDYGGAEVDVVLIISNDPADIQVGEGVQWTESYTKTLSTDLGIAFSVGKRLTNAFVDEVVVVAGGSGYTNGSHAGTLTPVAGDPSPTTTATFNFVVSGGIITSATMTNRGAGYFNRPTVSGLGGGTGASLVAILGGWPELVEKDFDEEMRVDKFITRRVVDPLYPVDPAGASVPNGYAYELKPIDKWHSWLEITHRTPTAVNEGSAIINYAFRPYKFPGTLEHVVAQVSDAWLGYRSAKADLVRTKIKTWWETGSSAPTPSFDEIISDTVVIRAFDRVERFTDVLHNGFTTTFATEIGAGIQTFLATSPSYDEYYKGTPDGTSTDHVYFSLIDPGAGYVVGDHLFFAGGSAEIEITATQGTGGFIYSWIVIDEGIGGSYTNPVSATGGSGTGAIFFLAPYSIANYTPGTAWVGTERVVSAHITQEKEKNL